MCREMEKMRDEAHAEGRAEEKRDMAIRMFDKGLDIKDISIYVEQSEEVIQNWLQEAGKLS